MDKYKIDSHKLFFHVPRVNDWLEGKAIYPIYMEVSPSGACNHRCTYCGLDFMEYKKRYLDTDILKKRLMEMGLLGLKSIMYAGEGEPFLHKDFEEIILFTKRAGIDVGITTNGVLLKEGVSERILGDVAWIKVSVDAATEETYKKIHRAAPQDFKKLVKNMSCAAKIKEKNNYKCVLGMQILLLPENQHEVVKLSGMAKDLGMDYLVIKPYSQHLFSKTDKYKDIKYDEHLRLSEELAKLSSGKFNVIIRANTMKKWNEGMRGYKCCLALPFWSYIDAGGNVWGCSVYLGDERFFYGNIYENSFEEIWKGERRSKSLDLVNRKLDISQCRINCRMDEINKYLWDLRHPPEHVNFI
jgi:radical SAM protein with 4Fe4S-binding SPASM domain